MYKIIKLLLLIKSYLITYLFKQSSSNNLFEISSIQYGKKSISLGSNNKFKKYSKISVDYDFEKQFINIDNNNTFETFSIVRSQGGYIKIGSNNFIGEKVQIQGYGGVEIGDNCMIAANTFISSSNHDFSEPGSKQYLLNEIGLTTIIDDSTWIGSNCTILAGVKIGKFCIIGAGSVVTKNIPDYHIAIGNPAKIVKQFDIKTNVWNKI